MVVLRRDSKVDEYRLAVLADHDVVWLDVLVDYIDDVVAVVDRLQHVDKVIAGLPSINAFALDLFHGRILIALLLAQSVIVLLVVDVQRADLVAEAAMRIVIGNEEDVLLVVDDLVQPDDVRVIHLLQHLQLIHRRVESRTPAHAESLTFEIALDHLLHGVLLACLVMLAQLDLSEGARTDSLEHLVLVDALGLFAHAMLRQFRTADDTGAPLRRPLADRAMAQAAVVLKDTHRLQALGHGLGGHLSFWVFIHCFLLPDTKAVCRNFILIWA